MAKYINTYNSKDTPEIENFIENMYIVEVRCNALGICWCAGADVGIWFSPELPSAG